MPFEYLEDVATADVAFRAWGPTREEMFMSAAEATVKVMVRDLVKIEVRIKRLVTLKDDTLEMLLFQFLQEIIFFKDAKNLILRPQNIQIKEEKNAFWLTGELAGEPIDPTRHEMGVDIKAVTFHLFQVRYIDQRWEATVVVDT